MAHINLLPGDQGVRLSTLSPKYLHTNSTSHTWPFSAVAELIDNAYDPDVEASQLWIDIERYGFEQCLSFTDNGAGMDSLKLHKMLSFGFCEKVAKKDHLPVGHYGNGFKSGSMRLGKDALVFTKNDNSRSVGFLSQTYLDVVNAQTILVPIVSWDDKENMIERADGDKAIQDILKHSLFRTKNELMEQFNKIKSQTGTRIVINSLRRTQEGKYEFDLRTDPTDIRIPDDIELESNRFKRQERQNHIPTSDYSLRAYCSILYLKPRMQIILRGRKVKTTVIAKSLSKTEVDTYKPQGVNKSIKVTFGFSQNKNHYGIMMYHRNRLIKPYVRVGYQMKANNFGVGVIGVIQCDYLEPTHNKQDFDYTKAYRSSMSALGSKLNDYWNEKKGKAQANSNVVIPEPKEVESVPDQLWVQCDNPECLKWRKLPPGVNSENLPEKWYCTDHPEEKWRSCDVPEELEDEKEQGVQPYVKKQKRRLEKELEEKRRKEKESKRMKELELEVKAQELKKKESKLKELMRLVENKSLQQQQQKQQREGIKKETASPQKVQVKVVGPAMSRYQATTPTKKGPGQTTKVFLTPVSTPHQILAVKTSPSTTPTQRTTGSMTATGSFLQKSNTTQSSVQLVKVVGPGPGPSQLSNKQNQVVAFKLGTVTVPHTGIHPKVSGPPVVLKVNSKAAAEQVKFLPTMVPVTAVVDPKVVSVQSLASTGKQFTMPGQSNVLIKCVATPSNASSVAMSTNFTAITTPQGVMVTPRNAIVTPGTSSTPGISMATPGISMVTAGTSMVSPGFSMATPGTTMTAPVVSMATSGTAMPTAVQVNTTNIQQQTPPKYLPLKSLIEVNRHATENTVSPITALIEDTSSSVPADKQNMKLISPQPMVRQDVTVNNRYRYIAPTGQPQGAQTSAAASTQLIVLQQVKQEAPAVNSLASTTREVLGKPSNTTTTQQTVVKTEPTTASPNGPNFKRRHEQSDDGPVARKQKTDNDVIIIDPPSPPPIKPADQSESIFHDQKDTSLPNMDTSMPNMDTCMPNMDTSIPNMDTSIPNMDKTLTYKDNTLQNRDYTLPNKDLVEQKFVPIVKDGNMVNIDKDIIEEVNSMSPQQQLQALLNRTQQLKQLYSLRENVLKLLQVLVPELEVDEFRGKYKDQTIDELLQQVLEQAEKSDEDSCTIVT